MTGRVARAVAGARPREHRRARRASSARRCAGPASCRCSVSVSGRRLTRGTPATLRVAARDPYGRSAAARRPLPRPVDSRAWTSSCATPACSTGGSSISSPRTAAGRAIGESLAADGAHGARRRSAARHARRSSTAISISTPRSRPGKPRWNESGTLIEGIHVWGELKPSLTEQDVFERAREIVRWSVAQGTLFIRAHADVSGENEAMVRGLLRAARRARRPLHDAGHRVPAGRHLRARRRRGAARERAPARRRLRRRDPALRADVRARPEGGAPRLRAREAVLAPHRRALRRDGRPELALPRGDGRRHREVRARRARHRDRTARRWARTSRTTRRSCTASCAAPGSTSSSIRTRTR